MLSQILAAATSVALIGAGAVGSADIRASEAIPMAQSSVTDGNVGDGAGSCRVDVVRSGEPGTVTSTRTVNSGGCVCTLLTGPAQSNGNAEAVIADMVRDRNCPESPTVGSAVSEAATSGGGSHVVIPVLLGIVGAAGLAVALSSNSRG